MCHWNLITSTHKSHSDFGPLCPGEPSLAHYVWRNCQVKSTFLVSGPGNRRAWIQQPRPSVSTMEPAAGTALPLHQGHGSKGPSMPQGQGEQMPFAFLCCLPWCPPRAFIHKNSVNRGVLAAAGSRWGRLELPWQGRG